MQIKRMAMPFAQAGEGRTTATASVLAIAEKPVPAAQVGETPIFTATWLDGFATADLTEQTSASLARTQVLIAAIKTAGDWRSVNVPLREFASIKRTSPVKYETRRQYATMLRTVAGAMLFAGFKPADGVGLRLAYTQAGELLESKAMQPNGTARLTKGQRETRQAIGKAAEAFGRAAIANGTSKPDSDMIEAELVAMTEAELREKAHGDCKRMTLERAAIYHRILGEVIIEVQTANDAEKAATLAGVKAKVEAASGA